MSAAYAASNATSAPADRIEVLDVLRGFSLLGIAILNAPYILHVDPKLAGLDLAIYRWSELLFRARFFPIFSLLFGVSFALLMSKAHERGQKAGPMFLRRLGVLAMFGLLHSQLQPGEVLLPYAVFGLLLLPFGRLSLPLVLGTSALIVLVALWTSPGLLTPAMFLLGLALQRRGVFRRGAQLRFLLGPLFLVLAVAGIGLTVAQSFYQPGQQRLLVVGGRDFDPGTLAGLVSAGALVTGLWLLTLSLGPQSTLLRPLRLLGRMSLSNYILQTLVFTALAWAGWRGGAYRLVVPACLLAYAVNFTFSAWWLARFRLGPLEWLWRWGTTLQRPELRRSANQGQPS